MRLLGDFSIRRNIHPGDDFAFLHAFPDFYQDETVVKVFVARVDKRFDAVVHLHGVTFGFGEQKANAVSGVRHTSRGARDECFT